MQCLCLICSVVKILFHRQVTWTDSLYQPDSSYSLTHEKERNTILLHVLRLWKFSFRKGFYIFVFLYAVFFFNRISDPKKFDLLCYDTCTTNAIYQNPACKFRSVRTNFDCTRCRNLACWRLLVSGDDPKKWAGDERDQWMSGIRALIRWAPPSRNSNLSLILFSSFFLVLQNPRFDFQPLCEPTFLAPRINKQTPKTAGHEITIPSVGGRMDASWNCTMSFLLVYVVADSKQKLSEKWGPNHSLRFKYHIIYSLQLRDDPYHQFHRQPQRNPAWLKRRTRRKAIVIQVPIIIYIYITEKSIYERSYILNGRERNEDMIDQRSYTRDLGSCEIKAWKKFRPERDSKPWPLRYRCSALPTELSS